MLSRSLLALCSCALGIACGHKDDGGGETRAAAKAVEPAPGPSAPRPAAPPIATPSTVALRGADLSLDAVQATIAELNGGSYLRVKLDLTPAAKAGEHAALRLRARCLSGGKLMVDHADELYDDAAVGVRKPLGEDVFTTVPLRTPPTACELAFGRGKLYEPMEAEIGRLCLTPTGLTQGPCAPAALAATAPAGELAVTDVTARLDDTDKGKYLRVGFAVTVARKPAEGEAIKVLATCTVDDKKAVSLSDSALDDLEAGESRLFDESPFIAETLAKSPSRCDLVFGHGQELGDPGTPLAHYCWDGAAISEGACK